jgi:hypothetical protein
MQPKLLAMPFRLAKSKALLTCGAKSIRFLPPRSVIGVEPTPFSLGSLAKTSEIFLGWYKIPFSRSYLPV